MLGVYFCVIFERINPKIDEEALNYLLRLSSDFRLKNQNIYFVFSSAKKIEQLATLSVKLERLTQLETSTILIDKYGDNKLTQKDIFFIHELSEGVVSKLDHVMNFLNNCSADELSTIDDLFDDVYYDENLSRSTRENIELLAKNPNRSDTFLLLKILAVLKNGESIKTIRKTKIGSNINPRNTQELTSLELATSVTIDPTTTIIRLNTIVKDYVLKITPIQEIYDISREFLPLTIIEGKEKIVLSPINRKTMEFGLKTEEDNAVTLLRNNIILVRQLLTSELLNGSEQKDLSIQLNRLMYLSRAYVYGLLNSSRFTEAATAIHALLKNIEGVEDNKNYIFYAYLAFAQRMLGKHEVALDYVKKAKDICPASDKTTLRDIAIDELYLLENLSPNEANILAKKLKNENKANSDIYIISDVILSNSLPTKERVKKLKFNERKARRLRYFTTANNLLLKLNHYLKTQEKLAAINVILSSEKSAYNTCRAKITKYEILLESGELDKITDKSILELKDIYNYLFFQGLESLFNRCHDLLWEIAVQREINDLIESIFYQGILIWRLNNDIASEVKYKRLYSESLGDIRIEELKLLK
ncbi:tetratricopeptide repeat protein [Klebsiella variicola]|nr:tetratricopeptide repeat protein [Klebsiella variicola]